MKRKASEIEHPVRQLSDESDIELDVARDPPTMKPQNALTSRCKTLRCPYRDCTKAFNRQARLTEHIRSHTNERPFECSEDRCGKSFLRDSHLKHHIKSAHTNERHYPCTWKDCDKKFATGTRLRRHEAGHQTKEKYTCKGFDGCNETFRKHATLSRHILAIHEKMKPFPCGELDDKSGGQCGSAFDTAEKLRSHHRAIHDPSRFVCMDCVGADAIDPFAAVTFSSYALLQNHVAEAHPPICLHCSLLCSSEKELRRHLELIHGIFNGIVADNSSTNSKFPCDYASCTRSFTKKGNLNVHIKTVHEHRKDFVCGETELNIPVPSPLLSAAQDWASVAAAAAPSEGPEVEGCGRHFTSKATLEEHVRTTHLGIGSKRQERNKRRRSEKDADEIDERTVDKTRNPLRKAGSSIAKVTGSTRHSAVASALTPEIASDSRFQNPYSAASAVASLPSAVQNGLRPLMYQSPDSKNLLIDTDGDVNPNMLSFDYHHHHNHHGELDASSMSYFASSALVDPLLSAI